MSSDPEDLQKRISDEVQAKRKLSENRFQNIVSGRVLKPIFEFSYQQPKNVREQITSSPRGTMVVSFHTISYFFLMELLFEQGLSLTAITTAQISQRLDKMLPYSKDQIDFSTTLKAKTIREVLNKNRLFFIMADVLVENSVPTAVNIFDKYLFYTTNWATLAKKLRLNVCLALLKDFDDSCEVYLEFLDESKFSNSYELSEFIYRRFSALFLSDRALWENDTDYKYAAIDYPDLSSERSAIRFLYSMAACDMEISQIVKSHIDK